LAYLNVGARVLVADPLSGDVRFYAEVPKKAGAFDYYRGVLYLNHDVSSSVARDDVITPFVVPILNIEEIRPAADQVARLGQPVEIRFTLPVNPYTIAEDVDNDGLLDAAEDLNGNNRIDAGEDVNGNGTLDLA